ncbi:MULTISPECIES: AAA family ATPase [Aerosakkonema]|uniref:AAA family ATPase n=1 Tax=Aerosakkonema TaxID=1246629 RepID=UPI0035B7331D
MFKSLKISNFGIFSHLDWQQHGQINVLIGENDTGKTYLLKLLYVIAKSVEDYTKRQQSDQPNWREVLAEKMFWVYQPEDSKLGELVKKGETRLEVEAKLLNTDYRFSFGRDTTKKISETTDNIPPQTGINTLFIPPKEILTAFDAIAATSEQLKIFGFDDTYQDLIKALRVPVSRKKLPPKMAEILDSLETLFNGEITREKNKFLFKRGREKFGMSQTAEGIKKVGILTTLIRNHTLQSGTILIIDEPEANLHPQALMVFIKLLFDLAQAGVQIYLATHSYTVVKQLEILARKYQQIIPLYSLIKQETVLANFSDLRQGMPDNPIIAASIQLYEEDVRLDLES